MLRSGTIAAVLCDHGGPDVGRRDVAVVPADSGVAAIRGGGHSEHAGISGAQLVVVAVRSPREHPVLKWGFLVLTAYAGVFGAFLYVLGCREPLPGLHERYV